MVIAAQAAFHEVWRCKIGAPRASLALDHLHWIKLA
jgi:hypothetical protein